MTGRMWRTSDRRFSSWSTCKTKTFMRSCFTRSREVSTNTRVQVRSIGTWSQSCSSTHDTRTKCWTGYFVMFLATLRRSSLEHRPSEARRLFAAALRSDNGHVQFRTTEALAILDEPWSRKELVAALHESDSDEETMSLRAALRKSRDHSVHAEVDRWEAEHLDEEDRLYCWDYKPLELPGRELGFTVEQLLSLRGRVE